MSIYVILWVQSLRPAAVRLFAKDIRQNESSGFLVLRGPQLRFRHHRVLHAAFTVRSDCAALYISMHFSQNCAGETFRVLHIAG